MKIVVPEYYDEFKCLADKCSDNCCIGWEIDIDSDTVERYESLSPEDKKEIFETIDMSDTPRFLLDETERCMNLDCRGLCKIISKRGEGYLCNICRDHPRYFNRTPVGLEGGIGLACEAAARLILTSEKPSEAKVIEYYEVTSRYTCDEMMALRAREYALKYIDGMDMRGEAAEIAANRLMKFADALDEAIFDSAFAENNSGAAFTALLIADLDEKISPETIAVMLDAFRDIEALTADFPEKLSSASKTVSDSRFYAFLNGEGRKYFSNLLCYYIHRYFLSDEASYLQNMGFAVISSLLICAMAYERGDFSLDNFIDVAKKYSKNVEYSEENVESVIENMAQLC